MAFKRLTAAALAVGLVFGASQAGAADKKVRAQMGWAFPSSTGLLGPTQTRLVEILRVPRPAEPPEEARRKPWFLNFSRELLQKLDEEDPATGGSVQLELDALPKIEPRTPRIIWRPRELPISFVTAQVSANDSWAAASGGSPSPASTKPSR